MTPKQLKRYDELTAAVSNWTDDDWSEAEDLRAMYLSISVDLAASEGCDRGELISRAVEIGMHIEIAQRSNLEHLRDSIARREVIADDG